MFWQVQEKGTEVVGTQLVLLQQQAAAGQLADPSQLQRTQALFQRMQVLADWCLFQAGQFASRLHAQLLLSP